jgi:hypothetical protein
MLEKRKAARAFAVAASKLQRRAESYEAPLAGMAGIMDEMEITQLTRRRRGRLPCWVASRSWRDEVTVIFYLILIAEKIYSRMRATTS